MSYKKGRILIVEDEKDLAEGICENLEDEGHTAFIEGDGKDALARLLDEEFDLAILDVMLPGMDGFAICRKLRENGCDTPVLFLTAKGGPDDRVRGLAAGGDDYLAKPFHLPELLLRVEAVLRRRLWPADAKEEVLEFAGNEIHFRTLHCKAWDGSEVLLTEKEAGVLRALWEGGNQPVSRETILEKVWGHEVFPSTRVILGVIERLREHFEHDPRDPQHLHTVRGVGYRLTIEPENRP